MKVKVLSSTVFVKYSIVVSVTLSLNDEIDKACSCVMPCSGMIIPQNSQNYVIPELTASSGSAYIYFYSDAAYNMSGFKIEYKYDEQLFFISFRVIFML